MTIPATSRAAVKTTCPYCGVGCGVVATRNSGGTVAIQGDQDHPANFGRLCSKGSALAETLSLDDRVLHPLIGGERASWETALDHVANRFRETIATHGSGSVAFYVSGQLLTEDYYVANKLMKGFIGSANIDTNSRLCMASSVAGHKRAFGSDTVPGCYEDLEEADLVVLVGSNLAWCHPVLYQRLSAAKHRRDTKVVVIDPRRTATCEVADLHLAIRPGTDVALFNGLLQHIASRGAIDRGYVWRHTTGLLAALKAAQPLALSEIALATGLAVATITEFYELFVANSRTVTVYSQGVNQSTSGTDKVNAIINCHLATGRIGRPGMGPFSVTGQPNAMGGREVGGLANMLAAHMDIDNAEHRAAVQAFWRSPAIADAPGLKAVDMFRAVADGRIKAIWIMATNPVDSMPDADGVRAALAACPFVVVSDVARHTDTTAHADVLLPSLAWGEKDGTVTNSERRISRQRAFLDAPGEARADWWQLVQVAHRMGWADAFAYGSSSEIFAEHAALTAVGNDGSRDLDIGAHARATEKDYDALQPFQWPQAQANPTVAARMFANGGFFTADRRARFVPTAFCAPGVVALPDFPLLLNTGRIRDQWHTMTRTAKAARLMSHMSEPFVEIHPDDAARANLSAAQLARVTSARGSVVVRVLVTPRQQRGSVFVPMHWTDRQASQARIDALVDPRVDPISGQPGLKLTAVRIEPFALQWYGFAVADRPFACDGIDYWAIAAARHGWRAELAGRTMPADWATLLHTLAAIREPDPGVDMLAYLDHASGQQRLAAFEGNRLRAALFVGPSPVAVARDYVAGLLGTPFDEIADRHRLLAGRAPADQPDAGPIVCACFEVGRNRISAAIAAGACDSVASVGVVTGAGTNCGSCRAEIGGLIDAARVAQAV